MAKYQAYAEYKDSGVEWLGKIPSHWLATQVKYGYLVTLGKMLQSTPKSSLDELKLYLKAQNIQPNGINIDQVESMWFSPDECKKLLLQKSDVLVSEGGDAGRSAIWNCELEECYIQNAINRVRPKYVNNSKYFLYWMKFLKSTDFINIICNKATIAHYTAEKLEGSPIFLPSSDEQIAIANFLDHETAKIDHLIEKQQQLIELLKEKRQAVISHAVTKGLNPNVPMKDSGVAWLGEVPEHWDVSKFAYLKQVLTDYTANGSFADLKANVQYLDEPSFARLVRLTDLRKDLANTDGVWVNKKSYEYLKKSALYGGEFLLANVGAYAGLFYQMPFDKGYASLAPNMFMAKFDQSKVSREFMAYVGQSIPVSSQLRLSATASSAQPKLNKDDFKAVSFVYPGLKEQQKIVDYLDQELKQIDILLKKQEQAISLMQERRTALISAAVTGKIDVRNWQAPTLAEADTELNA